MLNAKRLGTLPQSKGNLMVKQGEEKESRCASIKNYCLVHNILSLIDVDDYTGAVSIWLKTL